jgi:glycosyltransferase involved in cell wall biosynthesis
LRNWQNAEAASALGPVAVASVTLATETPPIPVAIHSLTDIPLGGVWRQSPTMAQADLLIPDQASAALRRVIAEFSPTAIVVEHPALVALAASERPPSTRLVADLHNIESVADARTASAHPIVSLRRWRAARAARASQWAERAIAAATDAVWACSKEEESRFRTITQTASPIHVVPNGVPRTDTHPAGPGPLRIGRQVGIDLVFSGHLAYPPNVDAVRWLAREILPALSHSAEVRLVLAGRSPAPAVQALAKSSSIRVVANPPDMQPILADADIAVLPIRLGGGTRFKVVEAMSRGLPVVGTRFAVEGLDLTDGVHFRQAETTAEFVAAIAALAADPAERARLREAAWSHCRDRFGPEAIARAVHDGLQPS